jgi:hypothetical protein
MKAKITFQIDVYSMLEERIGYAISGGWNRAHKHEDSPSEDSIKGSIQSYVMSAISEVLEPDEEADLV